jgi:hypothetical protein
VHWTGPCCTSIHRFQVPAVFYPNFYPERRHSEATTLYPLVAGTGRATERSAQLTFQAGHAGSIPVARSSYVAFSIYCLLGCDLMRVTVFHYAKSNASPLLSENFRIYEAERGSMIQRIISVLALRRSRPAGRY